MNKGPEVYGSNARLQWPMEYANHLPGHGRGKLSRQMIQGWGLLNQFSPFRYFPHFPLLSKQTLAIEYHVYIWQVSPQLSCGDTCQIWMWFRESNRYFCKIKNFAYGEISERSFSNHHPWQIRCHTFSCNIDMHTIFDCLNISAFWYKSL